MSKINYAMLKYDENTGNGVVSIKNAFFEDEPKIIRLDTLGDWIRQLQFIYENECKKGIYDER